MAENAEAAKLLWSTRILYDIGLTWRTNAPYSGGGLSKALCIAFALLAIGAAGWAELNWQTASAVNGGIGIGTSGYAMTLYLRAIMLAAISMAFGVVHLTFRILNPPRISMQAAEVDEHLP